MKTPLERHNEKQKKKLEELAKRDLHLQKQADVVLPGSLIHSLSIAYRDLQTSLNNLDNALRTGRSLLSSSLLEASQNTESQQNQDQQKNQESNRPSSHFPQDQKMSQYQPPFLESLNRRLKNLESRQISIVKRYRKCFRYLGFRQSFVDNLEGVASIYEDNSDPPINPAKGIVGDSYVG